MIGLTAEDMCQVAPGVYHSPPAFNTVRLRPPAGGFGGRVHRLYCLRQPDNLIYASCLRSARSPSLVFGGGGPTGVGPPGSRATLVIWFTFVRLVRFGCQFILALQVCSVSPPWLGGGSLHSFDPRGLMYFNKRCHAYSRLVLVSLVIHWRSGVGEPAVIHGLLSCRDSSQIKSTQLCCLSVLYSSLFSQPA